MPIDLEKTSPEIERTRWNLDNPPNPYGAHTDVGQAWEEIRYKPSGDPSRSFFHDALVYRLDHQK